MASEYLQVTPAWQVQINDKFHVAQMQSAKRALPVWLYNILMRFFFFHFYKCLMVNVEKYPGGLLV